MVKKSKVLPTSDDAPCLPLQTFTRRRVLLACILGTAVSVSAQGIIDNSDYISAPHPNVTKASTLVSTRTLHTVAPPEDGLQKGLHENGPGAEQPEMKLKVSKAQAPASAKHDNSTSPQQRPEDATLRQRPHNDSIPHQKRQEDKLPKQRQVDASLPAQRKPEDALPRKQHGGRPPQTSAPSGTRPGGQLEASSAAFASSQSQGPTTDSTRVLPKEATSATPAASPTAHPAPSPNSDSGTPEAAPPLHSTGMVAPMPEPAHGQQPVQLTAGQEALRELLDKAAAVPAQHSTAGTPKAPASRYAVRQGMLEGYFEVSPAPTPCKGYYTVRARSGEHSSQDGTAGGPRYSTQMAVSGGAAEPQLSITGYPSAAPYAEADPVQPYSPQSLPEMPIVGPSTETDGAQQAQDIFISRTKITSAAPEQTAPAQAPQYLADMYGQPVSIQALEPELAMTGAYAPGPGTEPLALEMKMFSAVYNAGYQAGYQAARALLSEHVRLAHTSPGADSPWPSKESSEVPEAIRKPLLQTSHPSQPPSHSQQERSQPQAYGQYSGLQTSQASTYGRHSPAPSGDAREGTQNAAAYSPGALPAQARHSYGNQAPAYAYQTYAYRGSYSKADRQILSQASAHEQAPSFQTSQFTSRAGADAGAPGSGPNSAIQKFAEAPVMRSYPGEQPPASAAQAAAPAPSYIHDMLSSQTAQAASLSPALSTSLAPAPVSAYSGVSSREAATAPAGAYEQQRPPAYGLQPVLPPGSGLEDTAFHPSQPPRLRYASSSGHSALAVYAPGPQPSSPPDKAPGTERLFTLGPAPAPGPAARSTLGTALAYVPTAPPVAYALVPAVSPSAYGAYGSAAGLQGMAPSGSTQPGLAPSAGMSRVHDVVPSAAPLPAPCEVCHRPQGGASQSAAPEVVLSILAGSELAQYVDQEGSDANVVYFVARAAFSRPPTNFTAQDVIVANGTAVDVISENACGQYLVKGYVQEQQVAGRNSTAVALSMKAGTLQDCAGDLFPAASAAGTVPDRPTGWLQAPDLGMDRNVSASGEPQVFLTLTFSQPVLSVSPADIRVNLTQSFAVGATNSSSLQGQSGARRSLAEDASGCVPEASVHSYSPKGASSGASRDYSFIVGLSDCFRGKVAVEYMGAAETLRGAPSLPVQPFYFWHPNLGPSPGLK